MEGTLKGYDVQNNLILDEAIEHLRGIQIIKDKSDHYTYTGETRKLGMLVVRGNLIQTIMDTEGVTEIENPFI